MFSLFKRFRNDLIRQGNLKTYLKYAIGEILLVMVGILLALQVNTWNERRIQGSEEVKLLRELRSDLEQSRVDIKWDQEIYQRSLRANQILLKQVEDKLPYHDSLNAHFYNMLPFSTFSINSSTFDNIRQSGSNLISNDSLRIGVSNFYTSFINMYKEIERRVLIEHDRNYIKPLFMSSFEFYKSNSIQPRNYEALIANPDFEQLLHYNTFVCEQVSRYQLNLTRIISDLIEEIDAEISRLE